VDGVNTGMTPDEVATALVSDSVNPDKTLEMADRAALEALTGTVIDSPELGLELLAVRAGTE